MKREKLIEFYGRRITPGTRIAGFLLIIAFGIGMMFAKSVEVISEQRPQTELLSRYVSDNFQNII